MASKPETVQVIYKDRSDFLELGIGDVLRVGREGSTFVIDWGSVKPGGGFLVYPGLYYYDPATDTVTSAWRQYVGKSYPKLHPRYEIVESTHDYLMVRRHDSQLFKFMSNFIGEIVENVYLNPGKSLWDIIVLESMIEAKDNPEKYREEGYRFWFAEKVVLTIGFLTYVCDLVELRFQ